VVQWICPSGKWDGNVSSHHIFLSAQGPATRELWDIDGRKTKGARAGEQGIEEVRKEIRRENEAEEADGS
jgi:hypothetical protein